MRNILFIAYHYHPDAAVGAQRTIKYARFLPEHGWQPHVVTVDPVYHERLDPTPLGFACPVTHTGQWPVPDDIYERVRRWKSAGGKEKHEGSRPTKVNPAEQPVSYPAWKRFFNALSATPDRNVGWYFPAVRAALKLVRRQQFDAVYTSGPPHTCHLVGLTVSRVANLPLIVDFRDPWHEPDRPRPHLPTFFGDFNRRFEAKTVKQAVLVVTTTPEWREQLRERYHGELDDKCVTVLNGFDETEFPPLDDLLLVTGEGPTTFFHGGTLYAGRDPAVLLRAAGELINEGFVGRDEIRFHFYGNAVIDLREHYGIIDEFGLGEVVTFGPGIKKTEYIRMTLQSDILVLFQSDLNPVQLPAKSFEYLATGNRILVLTGEGATREFMKDFDHVSIAYHGDKDQIKAALRELLSQPKGAGLSEKDAERIKNLTKERLAAEFAALLDDFVLSRPER